MAPINILVLTGVMSVPAIAIILWLFGGSNRYTVYSYTTAGRQIILFLVLHIPCPADYSDGLGYCADVMSWSKALGFSKNDEYDYSGSCFIPTLVDCVEEKKACYPLLGAKYSVH